MPNGEINMGFFNEGMRAILSAMRDPESFSKGFAFAFSEIGGNRISLGVQSLVAEECAAVGRKTEPEKVFSAIDTAKEAGITNISCDLLSGLPFQTEASLTENIKRLSAAGITHLSLYSLNVEEGTPLYKRKDALSFPDDEKEFSLYLAACELLSSLGFEHYKLRESGLPFAPQPEILARRRLPRHRSRRPFVYGRKAVLLPQRYRRLHRGRRARFGGGRQNKNGVARREDNALSSHRRRPAALAHTRGKKARREGVYGKAYGKRTREALRLFRHFDRPRPFRDERNNT